MRDEGALQSVASISEMLLHAEYASLSWIMSWIMNSRGMRNWRMTMNMQKLSASDQIQSGLSLVWIEAPSSRHGMPHAGSC